MKTYRIELWPTLRIRVQQRQGFWFIDAQRLAASGKWETMHVIGMETLRVDAVHDALRYADRLIARAQQEGVTS